MNPITPFSAALADAAGAQAPSKVRLIGQAHSPEAYAIRDFLSRTVVAFDWVELTCDADCQEQLGLPELEKGFLFQKDTVGELVLRRNGRAGLGV